MPVHDWTRVQAGIFHDFHHAWIEEIKRKLNADLLPDQYYALAEQYAAGFGPDVVTLQAADRGQEPPETSSAGGPRLLTAPPRVQFTAETELEYYRRQQKSVVVRHVSGDQIVAIVEVISPGNKASRHAAIWEEISGQDDTAAQESLVTLVAYESDLTVRAYVQRLAVGESLPDMPLFLEPRGHVLVPLEATYQAAWEALPRRWRAVLEPDGGPHGPARKGARRASEGP